MSFHGFSLAGKGDTYAESDVILVELVFRSNGISRLMFGAALKVNDSLIVFNMGNETLQKTSVKRVHSSRSKTEGVLTW